MIVTQGIHRPRARVAHVLQKPGTITSYLSPVALRFSLSPFFRFAFLPVFFGRPTGSARSLLLSLRSSLLRKRSVPSGRPRVVLIGARDTFGRLGAILSCSL